MPLSWPPPHPVLPHANRFPGNYQGATDQPTRILGLMGNLNIFGRDGNEPDPELDAWIRETLNDFPSTNVWGTWIAPGAWHQFLVGDEVGVYITIELRTAAEVHAQSGDPNAFAVTKWYEEFSLPLDGLDNNGDVAAADPLAGRIIRILIREDLAAGGAGDQWAGREFFIESVIHELSHATMMMLSLLYGDSYLSSNLCSMFGKSTSQWDSPSYPWDERVVEASAETLKDIAFPKRKYSNRTKLKLPEAEFENFKHLMFNMLENPYWSMSNRSDLHVSENQFFDNLGGASIVHNWNNAVAKFYDPSVYASPSIGTFDPFAFAWNTGPGGFNGTLRLCWNYDPIDPAAGNVSDPGPGMRWDDLKGPEWGDEEGFPIWDFSWETYTGNPGNHVDIELTVDFYSIDTSFVFTGEYYGSFRHRLGSTPADPLHPTDDERMFIPPIKGNITVDFSEIEFAPGHVALPPSFTAWVRTNAYGPPTLPKWALYPSEPVGFGEPIGKSYIWPWLEAEGERAHQLLRPIPWPYDATTPTVVGNISAGPWLRGTREGRPTVGRIGAGTIIRPATTQDNPPTTVLDGAQTLSSGTATLEVVTALGLESPGRIRVEDGTRRCHMDYTGISGITLTGVTFAGGSAGLYPDGAHCFKEKITVPA